MSHELATWKSAGLMTFINVSFTDPNLRFQVATVARSCLPDEFKDHGIRNLPALIHGNEAIDTVEEILDYINDHFPCTMKTVEDVSIDR